jgi:rod shape-determining protein MreD
MAVYRRPARSRFTLLLVVLTSVTLLTLDYRGAGSGAIGHVKDGARDLFAPVQDASDQVFAPVGDLVGGVLHYGDVRSENRRLRDENAELRGQVLRADDAERERRALREQLDLSFVDDIPRVDAEVVSTSPSNFELSIAINKGAGQGVAEGMPVVTGTGLVGRIADVSRNRSVVQLVVDDEFSVGPRHPAPDEGRPPRAGQQVRARPGRRHQRPAAEPVPARDPRRAHHQGDRAEERARPGRRHPARRRPRPPRLRHRPAVEPQVTATSTTSATATTAAARARLAAALLLALLLHLTLLGQLGVSNVHADALLLFAIAAGLTAGPERGAVAGFAAGLAADLFLQSPFGLSALCYSLVGFAIGTLQTGILRSAWWIPVVTAFGASAVGTALYALLGATVGETQMIGPRLPVIVLVVGFMNAALAPAAMRLLGWALKG